MYENLSIDDAAELLARRKVASAQIGGLVKQAEPDWGETLFGKDMTGGALRNTGLGAGAGALLGGLSGWAGADEGEGLTEALHGALRGGTVGGAVGGGATLGYHGLKGMFGGAPGPDAPKPPRDTSGDAIHDKNDPNFAGANTSINVGRTAHNATNAAIGAVPGYGVGKGVQKVVSMATRVADKELLITQQILANAGKPATVADAIRFAKSRPRAEYLNILGRYGPAVGGLGGAAIALATDPLGAVGLPMYSPPDAIK